jgi:hypothetical protein
MAAPSFDKYVHYDYPQVEPPVAGEDDKIAALQGIINSTQRKNFAQHRHCFRGTHIKTQAIVKGSLKILPNLPEDLAQGIASPANATMPHDVAIRFANEPSFLQDDRKPGPRGMGMKIFNVSGKFLDPVGTETQTHDILFNNAPMLELGDVTRCLEIFSIRERHFLEPEKIAVDIAKRDDKKIQMAPMELPNHHFLAFNMYSQSAFRWGPYVAKFGLFPSKEAQKDLAKSHKIDDTSDIDQHKLWLQDYFRSQIAEYDLCVQLCENLDEQSVEDTTMEWNEEKYPFRPIGKLVIPQQESFDAKRRVFWEEKMKLNVWYGLEEMRPLGSVNRLRKGVYTASLKMREDTNVTQTLGVKSISEIP